MHFLGVPYEVTVYTSDVSSGGTNADVSIVIYGKDKCTAQKSLCSSKQERKQSFQRGGIDKFVIEVLRALRELIPFSRLN